MYSLCCLWLIAFSSFWMQTEQVAQVWEVERSWKWCHSWLLPPRAFTSVPEHHTTDTAPPLSQAPYKWSDATQISLSFSQKLVSDARFSAWPSLAAFFSFSRNRLISSSAGNQLLCCCPTKKSWGLKRKRRWLARGGDSPNCHVCWCWFTAWRRRVRNNFIVFSFVCMFFVWFFVLALCLWTLSLNSLWYSFKWVWG